MFSRFTSTSALTIYVPPTIYTDGSTVTGELSIDFRQLTEENVEDIQLRLRGSSKTQINLPQYTLTEMVRLVRDDRTLWSRGKAYPDPDSHTLRIPFDFTLPDQLPPSFSHRTRALDKVAEVRYSLTAVGVRSGLLNLNKKHRVPLAILPRDELGMRLKSELALRPLKTASVEDRVRKGFWGDHSKVQVDLTLPDIPVLPLFTDIPYTIAVTTTSPPLTRAKADAHPPDKPVFPPAPASPADVRFALHRKLKLSAQGHTEKAGTDVAVFLGEKVAREAQAVESEVCPREWVPLEERDEKDVRKDAMGTWVQRATFCSTLRLDCAPTFALSNVRCEYLLVVKVPFSGVGNDVKLEVPVTVASGIVEPLAKVEGGLRDVEADAMPTLDLPPAYWDANDDGGWADHEKD